MALERRIEFLPAFDKRDPNPRKNYGIHGVEMRLYLIGEAGVIQWVMFTNWQLRHVQEEQDARNVGDMPHLLCHPMPADLGYHSPKPMYDDQKPMADCQFLGGACYYDGSSLNAEPIYWLLVEQGSDAVWKALEEEYANRLLHPMEAS